MSVQGERTGDKISVRNIEAREKEYTGTMEKIVGKSSTAWRLVEGKTFYQVQFSSRSAARQAEKLLGKRVKVKAQMTISGLMVHSVEEAK